MFISLTSGMTIWYAGVSFWHHHASGLLTPCLEEEKYLSSWKKPNPGCHTWINLVNNEILKQHNQMSPFYFNKAVLPEVRSPSHLKIAPKITRKLLTSSSYRLSTSDWWARIHLHTECLRTSNHRIYFY